MTLEEYLATLEFPAEGDYPVSDPVMRRCLWEAYGGRDFYTSAPLAFEDMQVDHIVPQAMGGPDNVFNYAPTNKHTNSVKSAKLTLEFAAPILGIVQMIYGPKTMDLLEKSGNLKTQRRNPMLHIDRVEQLKSVFTITDVQNKFGFNRAEAIQYCSIWKSKRLIQAPGGKPGIFFNMAIDYKKPDFRKEKLIKKILGPDVVIVGKFALYHHDWHYGYGLFNLELAIQMPAKNQRLPNFNAVTLRTREDFWHSKLVDSAEMTESGLLVASPEMALADAILSARRGHESEFKGINDESIDVPGSDALDAVRQAFTNLVASEEEIKEIVGDFVASEWVQITPRRR